MDYWLRKPNKYIDSHETIQEWIQQGENAFIDFKVTVNDPYKIAKTLAAFANGKGGRLLVGVADHGEIVGVNVEEDQHVLFDAATNYCDPPVDILFNWHEDMNIMVLEAKIEESRMKPHAALNKDESWQVYIRSNDKTIKLGKKMNFLLQQEDLTADLDISQLDSKQKFLLDYLKKNESVTLEEFSRKINVSKRRARRMIVDLLQNGYIIEQELIGDDHYSLSPFFLEKYK